ncbi:MAG: hypothetical protein ACUVRZ_06185 [Desulfobacca sp.]|uniref:hypothetical protein n=1 Tax=Desulfobacca sp. TaxID=2067990 RepID=UPI00404A9C9E
MQKSKWFFSLLALATALTLAGPNLAAAQSRGGGRGPGAGQGNFVQNPQAQTGGPGYRQGQGQGQGQRQRLHRRDGSCLNAAAPNTSVAPTVPTPTN